MRSRTRFTATETTSVPSSVTMALCMNSSMDASSASAALDALELTACLVSEKSSSASSRVPRTSSSGVTGSAVLLKSYPASSWWIPAVFTLNLTRAPSSLRAPVSLRDSILVNSPLNGWLTFTEEGSSTSTAQSASPVSSAAPGCSKCVTNPVLVARRGMTVFITSTSQYATPSTALPPSGTRYLMSLPVPGALIFVGSKSSGKKQGCPSMCTLRPTFEGSVYTPCALPPRSTFKPPSCSTSTSASHTASPLTWM